MGMSPNKPPMKNRVIRVPDKIWDAAKDEAKAREEDLSEAVRRMLTDYAAKKDI